MDSKLTDLQRDILEAFFRREQRFFLTGGGALAGYHLGHRRTLDLDLFTTTDILDEGEDVLAAAARGLGARVEPVMTSPTFRRLIVHRGDDSVVVDLVHDTAPQGPAEKMSFGPIRVDPPEEIMANKLCTVLARAEPRDLVDVMALDRAGCTVEDALPLAMAKDGGLTPAQLGWILSEIRIGEDASLPGGAEPSEVRGFLSDLEKRLARIAHPGR